jgi:hypothetical protein
VANKSDAKVWTIEELRKVEEERRAAWASIPPRVLIERAVADLTDGRAKTLAEDLRPLWEALPHDEPARGHLGSLIGVLQGVPGLIAQRLDAMPAA